MMPPYIYQDVVPFECVEGYKLADGRLNGTNECLATGNWSIESGCEPGNISSFNSYKLSFLIWK